MWRGPFAPTGLIWWGSVLIKTILDIVCLVGSCLFVGSDTACAM